MDRSEAYRCSHDRIRTLVDESTANVEVQACPGWTVKDVIAHLAGFFTAYQRGGQDTFGPGWGEREIESRRDRSLGDCLAEWSAAEGERPQEIGFGIPDRYKAYVSLIEPSSSG